MSKNSSTEKLKKLYDVAHLLSEDLKDDLGGGSNAAYQLAAADYIKDKYSQIVASKETLRWKGTIKFRGILDGVAFYPDDNVEIQLPENNFCLKTFTIEEINHQFTTNGWFTTVKLVEKKVF